MPSDQVGGEHRQAAIVAACPAIFDFNVPTVDKPALFQSVVKSLEHFYRVFGRTGAHKSNNRHCGLLRLPQQRQCRAPKSHDELAPLHSITSSARPSSDGGTERPSAFAVPRLITSSTFVNCWTGRSAGFSPFRMRPV